MKRKVRLLVLLSVFCVLFAATACALTGCKDKNTYPLDLDAAERIGTGETEFAFFAVLADGTQKTFVVKTDEKFLGKALLDLGLIAGDDGPYGLYVKTVAGETHVFEEDGKYWALYVDGDYAVKGADATEITDGAVYSFRAE